jgi:hypothetical protein
MNKTTTTTNLFATATKVKEPAKKTDKKVIKASLLADKVKRYAELKHEIDSATGVRVTRTISSRLIVIN